MKRSRRKEDPSTRKHKNDATTTQVHSYATKKSQWCLKENSTMKRRMRRLGDMESTPRSTTDNDWKNNFRSEEVFPRPRNLSMDFVLYLTPWKFVFLQSCYGIQRPPQFAPQKLWRWLNRRLRINCSLRPVLFDFGSFLFVAQLLVLFWS